MLEHALAIHEKVLGRTHPSYATNLNNLAGLLESQGDQTGARLLYERALAIYKETFGERHAEYTITLNNLAYLLGSQDEFAAARPLFERALAIRKDVYGEKHPFYATSLDNLAVLLDKQGDYRAARPLHEAALAIRREVLGEHHPDCATSLNNLANLFERQGDYVAASRYYEQALAINKDARGERHPATVASLANLSLLLWEQRDYARAERLMRQTLEFARANLDLAAAAQSERQQMAMARRLGGYLDFYLTLAPSAQISPAIVYSRVLATKGAVLTRQRRARDQRRLPADPRSEAAGRLADYQQTVSRLATMAFATPNPKQASAWQKTMDELYRHRDQLETELSRQDADFRADRTDAPIAPEQLAEGLPESASLVDLIRYDYRTHQPPGAPRKPDEAHYGAFLIRKGLPVERIEFGLAAPIEQALNDFRAAIQKSGDTDATGRELARLVWSPLESHLIGSKTVLLAPDGDLSFLPWSALPDPKASGHYLIERYALASVGSGKQLIAQLSQGAPAGPLALLAAGAVDYDLGDLGTPTPAPGGPNASAAPLVASHGSRAPANAAQYSPLPATGAEANAAADLFSRTYHGRADILVGSHATKEALSRSLPRHRYLHLATHGYFAPPSVKSAASSDPTGLTIGTAGRLDRADIEGFYPGLLSGLAWAGANKPPIDPLTGLADVGAGTMTAEEVGSLDLSDCELAVLSACETGLGRTAGGEGVLGLQRAFHQAGCRAVVASLWKVDDAATAALMTKFYHYLWGEKLDPIESLRKAQLDMLEGRLPVGGAGRGIGPPEAADPKAARAAKRVHPRFWAAWTISGPPTVVGPGAGRTGK